MGNSNEKPEKRAQELKPEDEHFKFIKYVPIDQDQELKKLKEFDQSLSPSISKQGLVVIYKNIITDESQYLRSSALIFQHIYKTITFTKAGNRLTDKFQKLVTLVMFMANSKFGKMKA